MHPNNAAKIMKNIYKSSLFSKITKTILFALAGLLFTNQLYATASITTAATNITASVTSSTSITISFTRPTVTGSGTVTYTATSTPGSKTGTASSGTSGGTGTITVTGLTSGTAYSFTVRAVADGSGNFTSAASNSVTPRTLTTYTFNATTNSNWGTTTNWSPNGTPTANDIVVIASNKTVVVSNSTVALTSKITMNSGASITNNGTLTVSPSDISGSALTLSGSNTFDNEGNFSITSANQYTSSNTITLGGTGNTLTFNGTTNSLTSKSGVALFAANASSSTTLNGVGFTVGSSISPSLSIIFSLTAANSTITLNNGTTLNLYIGNLTSGIYLSNTASFINKGALNLIAGAGTSGNNLHALNMWQTTASVSCTFANSGTFSITGFAQPTVFGGSTGYGTFTNTGIATIKSTDVSGAMGIYAGSNLSYVFSNTGTLNLYGYSNALKLSAASSSQTFTNAGTITITKGSISSSGISGTSSTYPVLNNNSGGVINFNYGLPEGTTTATDIVTLNNNSGATVNGSCTFNAGTFNANAGGTLSPGDYDTVNKASGIGIMVLSPTTVGTKYPLYGTFSVQANGLTTAGIDYDQLQCSELEIKSDTLRASINCTATLNDYIPLIYSSVSKIGLFTSNYLTDGWFPNYTSTNSTGIKYNNILPFAPSGVTAMAWNKRATVSFTTPSNVVGDTTVIYTVTSSPAGITATGSSSPITVSGLTNGTSYSFSVVATNVNGSSPLSTASNAVTPALNDLRTVLDAQSGNSSINIPKGSYSLSLSTGSAYTFSGLSNVTVEGNGSEIICDRQSMALYINSCTNFKMSNLSVDYDPLCFTQGQIIAVSSDHLIWKVKICTGYPLTDISTNKLELFDKISMTLKENYWTIYSGFSYTQSSDTLTITKTTATSPYSETVGDYVVMDVVPSGNIASHGIKIFACKNLIMDNVTIYGANSFSFFETDCENSTYNRCKVTRKTDDYNVSVKRLRSGNADGIHSKHASIGPTITNCRIEYNSDDCIAVNGNFYPVYNVDQVNGYVYLLSSETTSKVQSGDSIVLVDNNGTIIGDSKALTLTSTTPTTTEISTCEALFTAGMASPTSFTKGFRISIPTWYSGLSVGDLIYSKARTGNNFKIENDTVGYNRSRGVLIKASNGTIKNNYVRGSMEAGIVLAPEFYWMEAGCSSNVEISNNLISKCWFGASSWGNNQAAPLTVVSLNGSKAISAAGGFTNISIHDNTITGCPKPNVVLTSINGYTFYNNQLIPDLTKTRQHGKNYGITNTDAFWSINLVNPLQPVVTGNSTQLQNSTNIFVRDGLLNIQSGANENWHINLFDINAKLVYNSQYKSGSYIDLKHLQKGVYVVSLTNNNQILSKKLILL